MPAESEKRPSRSGETTNGKTKYAASGPELSAGLVSFTLDLRSGRIVKLEAVDAEGDRRDVSAEEMRRLAPLRESTLEDVLMRTFEAGISSVLDDASFEEAETAEEETAEESKLRRLILRPMIERSEAGRLLKREVLGRAILGTLIQDAMASQASAAPKSAAAPPKASPSPSRSAAASSSRRQPPRGRPH